MKHYKVIKKGFVEATDNKLNKIWVPETSVLGENLEWKSAVALRKANRGSEIVQQHSVAQEPA